MKTFVISYLDDQRDPEVMDMRQDTKPTQSEITSAWYRRQINENGWTKDDAEHYSEQCLLVSITEEAPTVTPNDRLDILRLSYDNTKTALVHHLRGLASMIEGGEYSDLAIWGMENTVNTEFRTLFIQKALLHEVETNVAQMEGSQ